MLESDVRRFVANERPRWLEAGRIIRENPVDENDSPMSGFNLVDMVHIGTVVIVSFMMSGQGDALFLLPVDLQEYNGGVDGAGVMLLEHIRYGVIEAQGWQHSSTPISARVSVVVPSRPFLA